MLAAFSFLTLVGTSASHAVLRENWILSEALREDQVAEFNQRLEKGQDLTAVLADPSALELETLSLLSTKGDRTLVVRRYPSFDVADQVQALTGQGWKLVVIEGVYPSDAELEILDRANPSNLTIGVAEYSGPELMERFSRLRGTQDGRVRIVFAARHYPRSEELEGLQGGHPGLVYQFYQNYWVSAIHTELMNAMDQAIELRVWDLFPGGDDTYEAVLGIQRLKQVRVDSDRGPLDSQMWLKLGSVDVEWNVTDYVPDIDEFSAFEVSMDKGARKLAIDYERQLPEALVERIQASKVVTRWIRNVQ